MATQLRAHLRDDEIFRIDHYLGKAAVRSLPQFRCATHSLFDLCHDDNSKLMFYDRERNEALFGHFWNGKYVRRIDVAMLETEDCK